MENETREKTFDEKLVDIRSQLKSIARYVMDIKEQKAKCETDGVENIGEVMANLTLAYRHLEDASMRIGKTIQARNGGVSIYDKNVVGSPETPGGLQTEKTDEEVEKEMEENQEIVNDQMAEVKEEEKSGEDPAV